MVLRYPDRKQYMHEMTDNDRIDLLNKLLCHKGYVMISGYSNELYNKNSKAGQNTLSQQQQKRRATH